MPETRERPVYRALRHFWAPAPWMLEATILLQLASGERMEAAMVGALLMTNVALAIVQEGRANATLALLRKRLAPRARVRRGGARLGLRPHGVVHGRSPRLAHPLAVRGKFRLRAHAGQRESRHAQAFADRQAVTHPSQPYALSDFKPLT